MGTTLPVTREVAQIEEQLLRLWPLYKVLWEGGKDLGGQKAQEGGSYGLKQQSSKASLVLWGKKFPWTAEGAHVQLCAQTVPPQFPLAWNDLSMRSLGVGLLMA